jgi:dolichol kinase
MTDDFHLKAELGRKAVHLSSVAMVLILYWGGREFTLRFLTGVLLVFLAVEYFRVERGLGVPIFWRFYRSNERETLGGNVNFMMGAIIAISVFPREIASAAIIMTTFGDMAAALVGRTLGRTWIRGLPERAWEGCLAEFVVDVSIGFIFVGSIPVILAMAGTATVVETLIYRLDDNLIIPLFAGGAGQLVLWLF